MQAWLRVPGLRVAKLVNHSRGYHHWTRAGWYRDDGDGAVETVRWRHWRGCRAERLPRTLCFVTTWAQPLRTSRPHEYRHCVVVPLESCCARDEPARMLHTPRIAAASTAVAGSQHLDVFGLIANWSTRLSTTHRRLLFSRDDAQRNKREAPFRHASSHSRQTKSRNGVDAQTS